MRHLFSFYPFYFDFHSACIIFYGSYGFYLWNINKTTADICKRCFVFTFDVFFSAETTMHCKVTCILYKKQAHSSQLFCLEVRSVTPWQLHDRKSRCLRGRRHSSILYTLKKTSKVNTILKVVIFKHSVILFRCSMIW
jgi:hypothetical protein